MLETWTSFFTMSDCQEFWDTWEAWVGLIAAGAHFTVDRITSEAEAMVLNLTQAKLKMMVSYPITFNLTDALALLLSALPSAQFCFQPKTRPIVDYYNLIRALVTPKTTNMDAIKVTYTLSPKIIT